MLVTMVVIALVVISLVVFSILSKPLNELASIKKDTSSCSTRFTPYDIQQTNHDQSESLLDEIGYDAYMEIVNSVIDTRNNLEAEALDSINGE